MGMNTGSGPRSLGRAIGTCAVFGSFMAVADYVGSNEKGIFHRTAAERERMRTALFDRSRPMDERVDLSSFGDKADEVRQSVREAVAKRREQLSATADA